MESNLTSYPELLTLQPLDLPPSAVLPALLFGLLTYCVTLFCNLMVLLTIIFNKTLHKPMFLLLLNLPVCDVMEATALFPQLIFSIVSQTRVIPYSACVLQAFLIHFCGTASFFILTAMAYDRYIAICFPLSYSSIMSTCKLIKLIVAVWLSDFGIIGTLILLFVKFRLCRTHIVDLYCNNPSLLKLVCENVMINNYFGMITIVLCQGIPLCALVFTYIKILITCSFNKQARVKAIQTCGAHLLVFFLLEILVLNTLILHRIPSTSSYVRRAFGVSVIIFPPLLNPLIYGFILKDIRERNIIYVFKNYVTF